MPSRNEIIDFYARKMQSEEHGDLFAFNLQLYATEARKNYQILNNLDIMDIECLIENKMYQNLEMY